MAVIRPCADLRNNYNEISKICHETSKPVYITKNGYNDLVVLSNEAFEKLSEENVNKKLEKKFDEKYADFESFKREVYQKIQQGINDIKNGNFRDAKNFFAEMEAKYNIND